MFTFIKLFITLSFGMLLLVGSGDSSDTNTTETNTTNTTTNTTSNITTNTTTNTNTTTENTNTTVGGVTTDNTTTETDNTNNDNETETIQTDNTQGTTNTSNSNIWNVSNISEFRQALENAAANGENDSIVLAKGTYNVASDNKGTLEFDDEEEFNLTIIAADDLTANDVILDGDNKYQIFNFDNQKATLSFKNISISNGKTTNAGAGVYSNANTIIENCIISNNVNNGSKGGGLYVRNNITVINSTFTKNNAWVGGGFSSDKYVSHTSIKNSSFNDNTAGYGGAFSAHQVNVEDSDFTNNIAQRDGGAFNAQDTTIISSNFTNNSADEGFGGAIATGSTIITNSNFSKNNANRGGAINTGKLTLINSYFSKNKANTYAIGHLRNISYVSNNVFSDNQGLLYARGIFVNNIFNNNTEDLNIYGDSKIYNNYIDESKIIENDYTVITKDNITPSVGDILLSNDGISLKVGSEAIDTGLNLDSDKYEEIIDNMTDYRVILELLQTDKVGNKRVHNGIIDMGAVEFGSSK